MLAWGILIWLGIGVLVTGFRIADFYAHRRIYGRLVGEFTSLLPKIITYGILGWPIVAIWAADVWLRRRRGRGLRIVRAFDAWYDRRQAART